MDYLPALRDWQGNPTHRYVLTVAVRLEREAELRDWIIDHFTIDDVWCGSATYHLIDVVAWCDLPVIFKSTTDIVEFKLMWGGSVKETKTITLD